MTENHHEHQTGGGSAEAGLLCGASHNATPQRQSGAERLAGGSAEPTQPKQLNELHLFAGAGGGILGGILCGHTCVCAVEINGYCRRVLLQRQRDGVLPRFPIWDDVRTFDGRPWRGRVDVVAGGFPCQSYSTAARGANNALDLWPEMRRIVADVAPRCVFAENVAKKAIDRAADELEEMGYNVRAVKLSASDVGADHSRERYWLRAYSDSDGELCGGINAEMEMLPQFRPRIWEAYPDESRMVDGVANRMERLAATGNGQVPAVVRLAWNLLSSHNLSSDGAERAGRQASDDSPAKPHNATSAATEGRPS